MTAITFNRPLGNTQISLRTALVAFALLVVGLVAAPPADAWTQTQVGGTPGHISTYRALGYHYNYSCPVNGYLYTCQQPSIQIVGNRVCRSSRTTGNQIVIINYGMQRWDGAWYSRWTSPQFQRTIPAGTNCIQAPDMRNSPGGGSFRVHMIVVWGNSTGGYLGQRTLLYNHAGDYQCNDTKCSVGNGFITLR